MPIWLREMIGFTAERLMALEVEGLTGAAHGERSADRISPPQSATATRCWETQKAGTVELKIPKLRKPASTSRASWSRGGWPGRRWLR